MLTSRKSPTASNFKVPIVNLTSRILSERERMQLGLGLEQSFINKNKNRRKYLAANLESINQKVPKCPTYNNLRHLINDPDTCIISADKDFCVVILKRTD